MSYQEAIIIDRSKRVDNVAASVSEIKLVPKLWKQFGKTVKSFTKRVFGKDKRVTIVGIGYAPKTEGLQVVYYTANDSYTGASNVFSFPVKVEKKMEVTRIDEFNGVIYDDHANSYEYTGEDNDMILFGENNSAFWSDGSYIWKASEDEQCRIFDSIWLVSNGQWVRFFDGETCALCTNKYQTNQIDIREAKEGTIPQIVKGVHVLLCDECNLVFLEHKAENMELAL